jgi:hypothetical protein
VIIALYILRLCYKKKNQQRPLGPIHVRREVERGVLQVVLVFGKLVGVDPGGVFVERDAWDWKSGTYPLFWRFVSRDRLGPWLVGCPR